MAHAGSWQPDGGSRLRADPEADVDADAAADARADFVPVGQAYTDPDAAAHRGAVARAVGQAYTAPDAATVAHAEPAPDRPPVLSERRAYATTDGRADLRGDLRLRHVLGHLVRRRERSLGQGRLSGRAQSPVGRDH